MSAPASPSFDIGPLSWVKTEIEHSLNEARANLDKLAADASDVKAAKYVVTHLHQVTGALSMVGLGAATRFNEEIEKLVTTLENDPNSRSSAPQRIATAKQATGALSAYLDSLMSGEPDRPMMLAPAYIAVNRALGSTEASEGDLFSPDLNVVIPMPDDTIALPRQDMLSEAIKQRRGMYQAGLLKLLRDKDMVSGARDMRNATLAIEALQVTSPTRSFWYAAGGFFDAVAADPAEAGTLAVQLFGKIDQQIKLLIEGVQKVPEKLFRDILLVVGKSKAQTERLKRLRELYRLTELLAVPANAPESDDDHLKGKLRALKEQIQAQKENWLKFSGGSRSALEPYVTQAESLLKLSQDQPNKDIGTLIQALGAVGAHFRKNQTTPSETQSLEVATAFLFVESSIENFFRLSADFSTQANSVVARLKGAMTGAALPAIDAGSSLMIGDMSKRAQERMLMFQVGQEVQVNLSTIENSLDAFFRDPQKISELSNLMPLFSQVQGALTIIELDEAAALNQLLKERVAQFASGAVKGTGEDAEIVAEGVSALGLYITALQQGATNPREALMPALVRFGLAEKPSVVEKSAIKSPVSEADVDVAKQKVQALYDDWKQKPEQTSTRDQLRVAVQELKQEAELIADSTSAKNSEEALKLIDSTFDPSKTGITEALSEIAPDKPTDAPATQVVQLIDAPDSQVDQELLEIFLEEATEVVGTIRDSLGVLKSSPHDDDALTTIRRGFHTLKGSGRMVGLNDLGEVGWTCEQVMNKWLKDGKPASDGLIGFVELSAKSFHTWVLALQEKGTARVDGTELGRLADQLKNDREPNFEKGLVEEPPAVSGVLENAPPIVLPDMEALIEPTSLLEPSAGAEVESAEHPAPTLERSALSDAGLELPALNLFDEMPRLQEPMIEMPPGSTGAFPAIKEAAEPTEESITPEPEDVRVGTIKVPHALFNIYVGEADQHIATLDNEMSALEAKPIQPVTHEFMRAAHTLTSSSRTTGFEMIADVAFALEKWLQEAIEFSPEFDSNRILVTRSAVDSLSTMVMGLHTREEPAARPDVVEALLALREALKQSKRAGDITHVKAPTTDRAPPEQTVESDLEKAFFDVTEAPPAEVSQAVLVQDFTLEDVETTPTITREPVEVVPPPQETVLPDVLTVSGTLGLIAAAATAAHSAPAADVPAAASEGAVEPPADDTSKTGTSHIASLDSGKPVGPIVIEAGKDRRAMADDIDQDLLPIFLEEAKEIIPQVGDSIRRWRGAPENHGPVTDLARHLHTLKGSARMAGLMRLGELAHVIESRVIEMDLLPTPAAESFEKVDEALDRFNAAIDRLAEGDFDTAPIDIPAIPDVSQDLPSPLAMMAAARAEIIAEGEKLEGRERQSLLRVNADIIDRFVNEAGELSIARSRIDQEMITFKQSLLELTENVSRMKVQLREIEIAAESQIQSRIKVAEEQGQAFDPLEFDRFSRTQELTRFMAESLNDVVTLQVSLQKNLDEAEAALLQQARLNRDLQQGLMGVRLVPLGNLQDRFYRLLRQTAKELNKKANLEFRGVRVEIDRSVLEKITAPIEHLLRNAVAHGVESPSDRTAGGKAEIGEITIDAQQVGNEVVLTLADDGAGLNFQRIREKAIQQGLLDATADVTDAQLTQFIFMPGFTTATEVTQIAGRGVGMDVVRNEIVSLGGRIDISSVAGKGTTFTIALPLTLAVTQAVMVIVGDSMYAIPSVMIEQVQEYKGKRYEPFLEMNEIEWKGNKYPLRSLLSLLGGKPAISAQRKAAVILAKSGQQRAAVQVDAIIGNREIVVKTIGPQLARLVGVAGATMTGSGQIVLILNPVQLVFPETATVSVERAGLGLPIPNVPVSPVQLATSSDFVAAPAEVVEEPRGQSLAETIAASTPTAGEKAAELSLKRTVPLVMVVDDSLTVRKITSRMLTREGFEVATAKDGVDALQQLQDIDPDIILLDIEMPRMDGFEFARNVRADSKARAIPIIMITSRTADKHRNHALEIGVNEYMGKPYQEEQLLALIRQYTGRRNAA